jgi:hypothetical protein
MDEIGEYTNVPVDAHYRSTERMKGLKKGDARLPKLSSIDFDGLVKEDDGCGALIYANFLPKNKPRHNTPKFQG